MPDEPEAKKGRLVSRFGDRSNVTPEEIEAYVDFRSSLGEKAPEAYAERHAEDGGMLARYCRAVVNPGESFVSFGEGRWLDWTQVIDSFEDDGDCVYMAYDNLPIKAYLYPLEQVRSLHRLDEEQELAFGETAVCPDCGYILMECR